MNNKSNPTTTLDETPTPSPQRKRDKRIPSPADDAREQKALPHSRAKTIHFSARAYPPLPLRQRNVIPNLRAAAANIAFRFQLKKKKKLSSIRDAQVQRAARYTLPAAAETS